MASYRYRGQIICDALNAMGHVANMNTGECDTMVFGKFSEGHLEQMQAAKAAGIRVVFDVCDDHFFDAQREEYRALATMADSLVAATTEMAKIIKDVVGRESTVIGDPYEYDEEPPHVRGLNLLWFGSHTNLGDLAAYLPPLSRYPLRVVSKPNELMWVVPWSHEAMLQEFARADIVILPTRDGAAYKTANRAIEAIRQGCFVVADKHPAYEALAPWIWQGDIMEGLDWCKCFGGQLNDMVRDAQRFVRHEYAPARIAEQWAMALTVEQRAAA